MIRAVGTALVLIVLSPIVWLMEYWDDRTMRGEG